MPFDLFPRQEELIHFLDARVAAAEEGLVEKSRDIGWTWVAGGYAAHRWRFHPGFKTTFGSRKEELVDRIGDPDSIFEKIRLLLYRLPDWMLPPGFDRTAHDNHRRLMNPDNGNTITGEAGDQMGRGGRSTLYLVDEGAYIERADRVQSAIVANSDCRIWASSVNGPGNLFSRKRHGGVLREDQIFRFHYTSDPRKTPEWAAKTRASMEEHVWAAEYEIDYTASVEGICIPAKWVAAAQRVAKLCENVKAKLVAAELGGKARGVAGLDVGGGGKGKSVFIARFGPIVQRPISWSDGDTTETAHRALDEAGSAHVSLVYYDSVGIGQGVMSTLRHSTRPGIKTEPINVGVEPSTTMWPDDETSADKFANLKAELWWIMRAAFKATYEHVLWLEKQIGGVEHQVMDLIALPSDAGELIVQLSTPKWFRNERGKIILESKQQLAARGVASPDFAEALALSYVPSDPSPIMAMPIVFGVPSELPG